MQIRVSAEEEEMGLNVAEHGATSSILELAHAMHTATESHDYSESLKVPVEHGTESGDLARCFNQMVDAVREEQTRARSAMQRLEEQQKIAKEGLLQPSG